MTIDVKNTMQTERDQITDEKVEAAVNTLVRILGDYTVQAAAILDILAETGDC